jgi:acyl-CoA synthetase (AMP-forming)/AMP-acid ligase II
LIGVRAHAASHEDTREVSRGFPPLQRRPLELRFCRRPTEAALAKYEAPRYVHFVSGLPRTPIGKKARAARVGAEEARWAGMKWKVR